MKIGNLICGICLVVLGLFSCTSEELIDTIEGDASLSVVLTVNDVATTKAGDLSIATEAELAINDFYVAIFNKATGAKIDGKIISSRKDMTPVTVNDTYSGYSVNFPEVHRRQGEVFAVVVANASSIYDELSKIEAYSELQTSVNTISTESFQAANLAKAGVSAAKNLTDGDQTLEVPLTQLCARIDFKEISVFTEGGISASFEPTEISYVANGKTVVLYTQEQKNSKYNALSGTIQTGSSFYTYEFPSDKSLTMTIEGSLSVGGGQGIQTVYKFDWANDIRDSQRKPVELQHGYMYELSLKLQMNSSQLIVTKKDWTVRDIEVTYGK